MNIPQGSEHEVNAPWNEKEKIKKNVEVTFFLERTETLLLECDEDGNVLRSEVDYIDSVGDYLAKTLKVDYVDYDFKNQEKFS